MKTFTRAALGVGLFLSVVCGASAESPIQPTGKQLTTIVQSILNDSRCPKNITFVSAGPAEFDKSIEITNVVGKTEVVVRDPIARRIYEITALNKSGKIVEWLRVDDVEPVLSSSDMDSTMMILEKNQQWLAALERRGLTADEVFVDIWPSGIPRDGFRFRNIRALTYVNVPKGHPKYSRPVEGLVCTVNLDARRMFEFYDREEGPILDAGTDPSTLYRTTKRKRLAPYTVNQRASSAIPIKNGMVSWNGWTFLPLVHSRDGLVLHRVTHTQANSTRSVAGRLSVSEILTTTSSTSQYWHFRQPLMVGEYGLGSYVVEQKVGTALPKNIRTLSASSINSSGSPRTIESAIALYEVDEQPEWMYTNQLAVGRRGRSLVVQTHYMVAQREIVQRYILSIDGSITIDVGVGGSPMFVPVEDSVHSDDSEGSLTNGVLVAPKRKVPYQSIACSFRLDLDVDGQNNTVEEVDLTPPHIGTDPYRQSVLRDVYPFFREREAVRDVEPKLHRYWRVSSQQMNQLSGTTGYRIHGAPLNTIVGDRHTSKTRAPYTQHSLWVTRFNDRELYAVGRYPNQQVITSGVNTYQLDNEKIKNEDVVVWLTQSTTYLPRVEDWPVAGLQHVSVTIEPDGFFDQNPSTDLPPTK